MSSGMSTSSFQLPSSSSSSSLSISDCYVPLVKVCCVLWFAIVCCVVCVVCLCVVEMVHGYNSQVQTIAAAHVLNGNCNYTLQ